jgi:hypothetical protein
LYRALRKPGALVLVLPFVVIRIGMRKNQNAQAQG